MQITRTLSMLSGAKKWLLMTGCAVMLCAASIAQVTVSGVVVDESGSTLIGANVVEVGTTNGTITDIDGAYSLKVAKGGKIQISYTGYTSQELEVGMGGKIDVTLAVDTKLLEEVVVTGYQVQRKRDISGAVSVIKTDDIQTLVASSFAQKLQGRAPGVSVSTSGSPGDVANVRIRGISSFGNNDPLYIVDGVPLQDKNTLLNINSNDIESMQVLKDPSSSSIYGSRASNGVIVITTKQGKSGKTRFTYNGSVSMANPVKGWDDILITDSNEYLDMTNQFFTNGGQALPPYAVGGKLPKYIYVNPDLNGGTSVGNTADLSKYDRYTNPIMETSAGTNWWDAITRTGLVQDHNINVSGGSETAKFNISAGVLNQEGVLQYNNFKRYSLRANSSYKVGKNLRIGQNLNVAIRSTLNSPAQSEQGVLSQVYKIAPIIPVYDLGTSVDENGDRNSFGGSKTANTGNASNPLAALYRGKDNTNTSTNLIGNVYAEYDLMSNLTFKTDLKYDIGSGYGKAFTYRSPENQENQGAQNFSENWGAGQTLTWTNTLAYNTTFSDRHKVGVLLGYESLQGKFRTIGGSLNNYFTTQQSVWYLSPAFGQADTRSVSSNGGANKLLSAFGKVDYSLDDKYYLSGTVRRDGSSRFSPGNRYATFTAVSAAWRLSGEDFMKDNSTIDDLKLRLSYGQTGNENIPGYNYVSQWGGNIGSAFYDINGANSSSAAGYHLLSYGSDDAGSPTKWESGTTINGGVDVSLLDGKWNLVLDVYQRKTTDLLYNAALPLEAGEGAAPYVNVASMKNTGFDLGLGYRNKASKDFSYTIDLNVSRYKNVITEVGGGLDYFYPNARQGVIDNRLPQQININQVGYSISQFRGYQLDGIFANQAEIDALSQPGSAIGGLRFKDLNGDKKITDDDLGIIGTPHPDFSGGLNLGGKYKNLDFSAFFSFSYGNQIFNYTRLFTHFRQFFSNVSREYYLENGKGDAPKLNILDTGSRQASEYYVEDASYIRLGQLSVGYSIPMSSGNKAGLKSLRLYVQGQNLFTITGYSGLDPVLSNANIGDGRNLNDIWTGFDIGQYPSNKLVTVGVSAEF